MAVISFFESSTCSNLVLCPSVSSQASLIAGKFGYKVQLVLSLDQSHANFLIVAHLSGEYMHLVHDRLAAKSIDWQM